MTVFHSLSRYLAWLCFALACAGGSLRAISVDSFTLINADTDRPVEGFDPIKDGAKIDVSALPTKRLNIRANVSQGVSRVTFVLTGATEKTQREGTAPFALAADTNGDYEAMAFANGAHTLVGTPYGATISVGDAGTACTIHFSIENSTAISKAPIATLSAAAKAPAPVTPAPTAGGASTAATISVTSFTLINADSNLPIAAFDPIPEGAAINVAALGTSNLNVRANVSSGVATVAFSLTGATTTSRTEGVAPFALAGDNSGDYVSLVFANGAHTLVGTPYPGTVSGGNAGTPTTLHFTISNSNGGTGSAMGPVVAISSPATGTTLMGVGNFALAATAWNGSGAIASVEFFRGTTSLGIVTAPPYQVAVSGLAVGEYVFTAKAKDYTDHTTTSAAVGVRVVSGTTPGGTVTGELKQWHPATITFDGPQTDEANASNPFRNYRLDVTFTKGAKTVVVPGYFAADGNAGETSAVAGSKWRVRFAPDEAGTWNYVASFRSGTDVAIDDNGFAGTASSFDRAAGSFVVGVTDKTGNDFRGKGLLRYVGSHYLQFAGSGEYFLKGGAGSPEDFLGYFEFDGTSDHGGSGNDLDTTSAIAGAAGFSYNGDGLHHYAPHVADWHAGDPVWQGVKGKGIIGSLNYLASVGANSFYFLTNAANGDGCNVYPSNTYNGSSGWDRYDCSKLDQWEVVFAHMDKLGIFMNLFMQETENDQLLDGGDLGPQRKVYHRELVARFSHHLAMNWELGEENTNTDAQRKAFCLSLRALDPYRHPITVHITSGTINSIYNGLLGFPWFEGTSFQEGPANDHATTLSWRTKSEVAGRPWFLPYDEQNPADTGLKPDADDATHDSIRQQALWGNLMAGGSGCDWYFGYSYPNNDIDLETFRTRATAWAQTRAAVDFFQKYLPFPAMEPNDALSSATGSSCLAKPSFTYAIYLPQGGTTNLNLTGVNGSFKVRWFDPRSGGSLQDGSVTSVTGGGSVSVGNPPSAPTSDWVVLVQSTYSAWGTDHFDATGMANAKVGAADADPDGDGFPNLLEMALNGDPAASSVTIAPQQGIAAGHLTLTYRHRTDLPGVDVVPEVTNGLNPVSWLSGPANVMVQIVGTMGNLNTVVATDRVSLNEAQSRFIRLRVFAP